MSGVEEVEAAASAHDLPAACPYPRSQLQRAGRLGGPRSVEARGATRLDVGGRGLDGCGHGVGRQPSGAEHHRRGDRQLVTGPAGVPGGRQGRDDQRVGVGGGDQDRASAAPRDGDLRDRPLGEQPYGAGRISGEVPGLGGTRQDQGFIRVRDGQGRPRHRHGALGVRIPHQRAAAGRVRQRPPQFVMGGDAAPVVAHHHGCGLDQPGTGFIRERAGRASCRSGAGCGRRRGRGS